MSQKEKRLLRLFKVPPAKDFTWEELLTVMRAAGFKENCDGGSHYSFTHGSGFIFTASKTHPTGILKRYQIMDAQDALRYVGVDPDNFGGKSNGEQ